MNMFAKALNEGRFYVGGACDDCQSVLVNGDGSGNDPEWNEAEFDRVRAEYDITPGHPHNLPQWFTDCSHIGERCPDDDCDCERNTFSTSQCDACGTYLHGERHDFIFVLRSDMEGK